MFVEHVTYVYSCRSCDKEGLGGFIKKAESPNALIPKSMVSPSVKAYILNQKYTNAMPLYRQEQEFKRYGVELNRQNLSNWTMKGATLLKPLVLAMKQELFSNTQNGASSSALIYSVIQTAIANQLKPLYYFEYIFEQIQMEKNLQIQDLLPWSEKIPERCKNSK